MSRFRVVIAYNTSWYVHNFRLPLIRALLQNNYEVIVLAPKDEYTQRVVETGVGFREITVDSKGNNPLRDLATFFAFFRAYSELKPNLVLQYTIKPNLYGSIAARLLGVNVACNVTGLGAAFSKGGLIELIARTLYRIAFAKVERVFFQNPDDMELFLEAGLVEEKKTDLLPGSGVDTERFTPESTPRAAGPFRFLFVGRLLKEKGVEDLIEATALVRASGTAATVSLLGRFDPEDPHTANPALVKAAVDAGHIFLAGETDDVRPYLAAADCVVLPSYYREGTPRSLLEAIAMGKPVIAADSVGTREPVHDSINGFLHTPRDPRDLADRMLIMATLPQDRLRAMGDASRAYALERYREEIVIDRYLALVASVRSRRDLSRPA